MDTTAPAAPRLASVVSLHGAADPTLPAWMVQLVTAAMNWAEDTPHTCTAPARGNAAAVTEPCDACYWAALYAEVPGAYKRGAAAAIAQGYRPDGRRAR